MIISFKHNFIFMKSRKVAGTSVEIALSHYVGADDIATPISPQDERLRLAFGQGPQNYLSEATKADEQGFIEQVRTAAKPQPARDYYGALGVPMIYQNHMHASELIALLDPVFWQRSYKFSIERHPYEKAVSFAWFFRNIVHDKADGSIHKLEDRLGDLSQTIDFVLKRRLIRNYDIYAVNQQVVADKVVRYEHLEEDLRAVEEQLGLSFLSHLPRTKANSRKDRTPARDILSSQQKAVIQSLCAEEFALFDYET
ncbi:MAG: hypothetical protein AAF639_44590 [Chloroflexota bacterium]